MTWSEHIENYNGYHVCSSTNQKCQSPIAVVRTWTSCTSGLQWSEHLGSGVGASPWDYSREVTVKCCCLSGNSKCDGCNYYEILREYQRQQQIQYEQRQQQIQYEQRQKQIQYEQRQKQIQYEQREQLIQKYMKDKKEEEKICASLFYIFGLLVILIILYVNL